MADHQPSSLRFFPVTREAAWRRYLDTVRSASEEDYGDIEQAAWSELQAALTRIPGAA